MFNSNKVKSVLVLILLMLMSACASLKPVGDSEGEDPAKDNTAEAKEASDDSSKEVTADGQGSEVAKPRVAAPDPMKDKDVSLALIKLYDQVKGLQKENKIDEAIALLEASKSAHPESSGPSYRLARLYLKKGDYEKALDASETAISINQSNYYAINLKGVILREQGKFQEAKGAYTKALEVYPDYANAHLNLAILSDIYLYDLNSALTHYETYMLLTSEQDKKVSGWLIDLKRRMPKGGE